MEVGRIFQVRQISHDTGTCVLKKHVVLDSCRELRQSISYGNTGYSANRHSNIIQAIKQGFLFFFSVGTP